MLKEVTMKWRKSLLIHSIIILMICSFGCTDKPSSSVTSVDGVEIHFKNQGKGKPAIVFVHGWTNNKSIWDGQLSHFSKNYNVTSIDLAGHGESGDQRSEWTMSAYGEDVVAVIKKLDLNQIVLVGFSMGTSVIVETANKIPERIAGIVFVDDLKDIERKYTPEMISLLDSVMIDALENPTPEQLEGLFYKKNPDSSFHRISEMLKNGPRISWSPSLREYMRWLNEDCISSLKKSRFLWYQLIRIRSLSMRMLSENISLH